jgi:hypothetical protein
MALGVFKCKQTSFKLFIFPRMRARISSMGEQQMTNTIPNEDLITKIRIFLFATAQLSIEVGLCV